MEKFAIVHILTLMLEINQKGKVQQTSFSFTFVEAAVRLRLFDLVEALRGSEENLGHYPRDNVLQVCVDPLLDESVEVEHLDRAEQRLHATLQRSFEVILLAEVKDHVIRHDQEGRQDASCLLHGTL